MHLRTIVSPSVWPATTHATVVLCTQRLLPLVAEECRGGVCIVDAVPTRSGFSTNALALLQHPQLRVEGHERAEVTVSSSEEGASCTVHAANTVFSTGQVSTALCHGQRAPGLRIQLPGLGKPRMTMPLQQISDWQRITDVQGNIIAMLGDSPAAKTLNELQPGTDVYVRFKGKEDTVRVIAGGGEWGHRAGLLALDDDYAPACGEEMSFFLAGKGREEVRGVVFGVEDTERQEQEETEEEERAEEGLFGAISRKGLFYGSWCRVPGARLAWSHDR